jgi:hypothetical protein
MPKSLVQAKTWSEFADQKAELAAMKARHLCETETMRLLQNLREQLKPHGLTLTFEGMNTKVVKC